MNRSCPDCQTDRLGITPAAAVDRRQFLATAGAAVGAATLAGTAARALADAADQKSPETLVKLLYDGLNADQRKTVCFAWDHVDAQRGLLRTHISNNWHITEPVIGSDFFTKEQQRIIRDIFEGMIQSDWHRKIDKQLLDDAGGYGEHQNIAIFGKPGEDKFQFVMTGRHMTLRCDGNSAEHVAFGGPIFYGHAASGFNEKPDHPGNVFWEQAVTANGLFQMLDGKQRKLALVARSPAESRVGLQGGKGQFSGIPVAELSADQQEHAQQILQKLIEPYRQSDRDEVVACLKQHGGLDACHLAFYADPDLGDDGVWDNWRLEGPSFVWYFRGAPHVHVWVNVSADPSVKLNAAG